jgi:putative Mg2+ transporter-C (MgtC) family protein
MAPIAIPVEVDMAARVLFACLMGLLIGLERRGGPSGAGMRTFALICMGSALFTVLSVWGFPNEIEPSRLAAQIVTGIGFIGAGVIWRQKEESIHGITTAAAIWVSAAVGIASGLGFFFLSFTIAFVVMMILARGHLIKEAKVGLSHEFNLDK